MKPVTAFDNYPSFANGGSKSAPGDAKYALGFVAADTFPAEWANYFFHGATKGVSDLNTAVRSIWVELQNILTAYGISADISEESQLLSAIGKIYPRMTSCSTAAATEVKSLAITGEVLKPGNVYVIDMTNGNSYGDGISTYPKISINSGTSYPICDANGKYLASGAWEDGDTIKVLFTGSKYLMATPAAIDTIIQDSPLPITSGAIARIEPIDEVEKLQTRPPTSNAVSVALSYSATKTFTGKYWIDGKKIYRKVYSGTSLPSSGTVFDTGIDAVINQGGFYIGGGNKISVPYNSGTTKVELRVNSNNQLYIQLSSISSVTEYNFWVEYTEA